MDEKAIKKFVAQQLQAGVKLTEIQNLLASELNCKMTFLDLRLLAAELEDVDWKIFDAEEKAPEKDDPAQAPAEAGSDADAVDSDEAAPAEEAAPGAEGSGTTTVELSRLTRPGALAHGTVTFASGATAEWLVDEMGRLGLDKVNGQPTEADFVEFQKELQRMFSRR